MYWCEGVRTNHKSGERGQRANQRRERERGGRRSPTRANQRKEKAKQRWTYSGRRQTENYRRGTVGTSTAKREIQDPAVAVIPLTNLHKCEGNL